LPPPRGSGPAGVEPAPSPWLSAFVLVGDLLRPDRDGRPIAKGVSATYARDRSQSRPGPDARLRPAADIEGAEEPRRRKVEPRQRPSLPIGDPRHEGRGDTRLHSVGPANRRLPALGAKSCAATRAGSRSVSGPPGASPSPAEPGTPASHSRRLRPNSPAIRTAEAREGRRASPSILLSKDDQGPASGLAPPRPAPAPSRWGAGPPRHGPISGPEPEPEVSRRASLMLPDEGSSSLLAPEQRRARCCRRAFRTTRRRRCRGSRTVAESTKISRAAFRRSEDRETEEEERRRRIQRSPSFSVAVGGLKPSPSESSASAAKRN